ncbi:MAG: glutamate formimidoyltransferase [Ignavibacteria bacterium]
MKIIECVPNFSEGKNPHTFQAISEAVGKISNVKLLSLEPDADYNRVVVTLAGNETGIVEGTLAACKAAAANIDMTKHKGEHPRLGAIDVAPFVPVKNATMEDCVRLAEQFGKKVAEELDLPVYLYEEASRHPSRKLISNIRKGEYEGLEAKLLDPLWYPDFGQANFNPKLGALITGARSFLIAYNVNIHSTDISYAKEIAEILRETGRPIRNEQGEIIKINGEIQVIPGRLKTVQAMGILRDKYNITQVSMNLRNYHTIPIHIAFEEVKKEAGRLGVEVNGSEIVGLVPLDALLSAGRFYSNNELNDEKELVKLAIRELGLSSFSTFMPKKKVIDYMI